MVKLVFFSHANLASFSGYVYDFWPRVGVRVAAYSLGVDTSCVSYPRCSGFRFYEFRFLFSIFVFEIPETERAFD